MNATVILPLADPLAAYREAALEIRALRRRGIRCHLEQHQGQAGPFLEIIEDHHPAPRFLTPAREKICAEIRTPCAATAPARN
ncbi:hypothetical protein [Haloferula sp. BvORR071]|uniref:hypothetical protein n=1 Tax=Haloferula sp. BvORR071 TaxID=1396141 RepID=UPI000556D884|nr:hypothetical protein [Haloferula sp. BvORR071]